MITTELHKLPLVEVRNLYKEYLIANGKGQSTVQTYTSDTFYLWNKVSKEAFWDVVCSDDFDTEAKTALHEALTRNSSGQVDDLVVGYVAVLKMFRNFVTEYDGEIDATTDEEALKNFLLDIDCLDQLDEWTGKFNMFDILKITRAEIRHRLPFVTCLKLKRKVYGVITDIITEPNPTKYEFETWFDSERK